MLQLFEQMDEGMNTALAVAVPLISGIAELIGLLIIVVSLLRTTYHYLRVVLVHDDYDYHLEMSTGLITALEFHEHPAAGGNAVGTGRTGRGQAG